MSIRTLLGLEENRLSDDELAIIVSALEHYYDNFPTEGDRTFTSRVDEAMRINAVRLKILRSLEP